jgi:CHAT domain-containing protein
MPGVKSIDAMRQKYEDAIKSRRDELVNNADIDAAEKHLTDFVQELDKLHIFSEELDTMKTAALQYLGDYNRAMETITRVLPTSFGGTRDPFPILEGPSKQIKDVTDKAERQKFDRAVSLCFAAKDWKRGMAGVQAMLQRDVTSLDDMKKSEDPHIWYNMVCIASVLEHNMELGLAFEWYLGAFDVIEAYRQQLADIEDRRDILSSISSGEIFLGLARIAFHFSQTHNSPCGPSGQWILTSAEWKDQILRFLELGRSRTLLDLLTAQELASKENFEKDFEKWADYSYELRRQESPSRGELTAETNSQDCTGSESEGREKYLERIHDELVKELNPKNLSTFLSNPVAVRESNAKLYQSIPETAIVLHISSGREGLMILCITSQGIIDIHTSELTGLQLDRHIFRFAKLFRHKGLEDRNLPTFATCNQHIQAISDALIEPVAQHIKMKEHVIFIPSPSLNKFPLCALVYNKEPLFLSKDVSQVPSLSILQYLVDKKRHNNKKVSVIYNNPNAAEGPLFVSTSAAIYIARSFHTMPQAAAEELTLENFANIYEQSDVLLLATHGTLGLTSAWESYLSLKEPFLVRNLVRLHSEASLIIFEACVSGLGEESIGNDLLGFSHAVIGSGVNSFLGGLWYLRDHATALLMLFLFEEFETDKGSKTLARCWRNAQKKLYKLDVAGALEIFEDMSERCVEACDAKLIDEKLKISLRRALRYVIRDLPRMGVNYNHPFYWAGFVLTGHAGLMLEL